MDPEISAAARALAVGDPLEALKRVALRNDADALALHGIAMAQLGELVRARELLRAAARAFGPRDALARARCIAAEAEIALACRDLTASPAPLAAARRTLEARGDRSNALFARCLEIRRSIVLGRVAEAARALASLDLRGAPPMLVAVAELLRADVALRTMRTPDARDALAQAMQAARRAGVAALVAEVTHAATALSRPAALRVAPGEITSLRLDEVEALYAANTLLVDGCRRLVRDGRESVSFARRPVLFALVRALAEASPNAATRATLIARGFGVTRPNASHRARLRVEIGRVRRALAGFARLEATADGFAWIPHRGGAPVVLAPVLDDANAGVLALLADGNAWSSSAIALALGASQRTTQRALVELEASGKVRGFGRARARRWVAPPNSEFTTILLLPVPTAQG